jgi:CheY-like chemotaxis protein
MSHEIRTPMNSIVGMIDLALMTEDSTEEYEYLTTARESARYLLGVISDILDISRIEAGRFQLEEDRVQPLEVAESAGRMLRPMAEEKGLNLVVECIDESEEECPPMITDRVRLRQVIVNLLSNALKFTDEGEVRLNIGPRRLDGLPGYLQGLLSEKENRENVKRWLYVSVSDTGIGITLDQQKIIFEQFRQVETAMSRRYGGTGLGLAISRQLVDRMGGVIGMESFPGQGSTFCFAIPWIVAGEGDVSPKDRGKESVMEIGSLHVLLAEDNPVNVRMAKVVLEKLGHLVRVALNGEEALEALKDEDFDLVIMDVEMPVLNGIEATEKIRQGVAGEHNMDIPVIAMTAHAISEVRDRCMKAGMNGYITKPVDITRMQSNLAEILTQKQGTFSRSSKGRIDT